MKTIKETFRALVSEQIAPWLRARGFRRSGSEFTRSQADGVQRVAVHLDEKDDRTATTYYFVFIEFPEIERLRNFGRRDKDAINTVGKQMGFLRPPHQFDEWSFDMTTDLAALGERFARDLEAHGLPFLEKYSRLAAVKEALEAGELFNVDAKVAALLLASIYYQVGEKERAVELLDAKSAEYEGKPFKIRFAQLRKYLASI